MTFKANLNKITTLYHEVFDDPVECWAFVAYGDPCLPAFRKKSSHETQNNNIVFQLQMIHIHWLFCFPSTQAIDHFLVACQPNSLQHIIIVDSASEQIQCILDITANSSNLIE